MDIIFTPPIEYQQYRRKSLLESKVEMLKSVLGEESVVNLFSEAYALEFFMGWDKDTIELNKKQRFQERVFRAKEEALLEKVKTTGTIDFADEEMGLSESLKDILLKDIESESDDTSDAESGGDESGDTGDEFGDESLDLDGGDEGDDAGGDELEL